MLNKYFKKLNSKYAIELKQQNILLAHIKKHLYLLLYLNIKKLQNNKINMNNSMIFAHIRSL